MKRIDPSASTTLRTGRFGRDDALRQLVLVSAFAKASADRPEDAPIRVNDTLNNGAGSGER
jgi:hypothetical protein